MKNINVLLVILFSLLLFSACNKIYIALLTRNIDKDIKVLQNDSTQQTIVFIPMVHVGKEEYFLSVRKIIDSLRKQDYSFYYEGVLINPSVDSLELDTLQRKLRKVIGFHLSGDYTDFENKSSPKFYKNDKYLMQNDEYIGINENDSLVDLSLDELIKRYERGHRTIHLSPCDFETNLMEKYKCKDTIKYNEFYMLRILRDDYISKHILKLEEDKIALIYGKSHWWGFYPYLRDSGYKIIHGKL